VQRAQNPFYNFIVDTRTGNITGCGVNFNHLSLKRKRTNKNNKKENYSVGVDHFSWYNKNTNLTKEQYRCCYHQFFLN
jgi:hypothetical protein